MYAYIYQSNIKQMQKDKFEAYQYNVIELVSCPVTQCMSCAVPCGMSQCGSTVKMRLS